MSTTDCYPDKAPKITSVLDTLCNNIRRELVHYFENLTTEETATLDELVAHIERRVPGTVREELLVSLHHTHLPKLESRGWIDVDYRRDIVRYHGHSSAGQLLQEVAHVFAADHSH